MNYQFLRYSLLSFLVIALPLAVTAQPATTLDELYDRVVKNQRLDAEANRERIRRFEQQLRDQEDLLEEAQAQLATEQANSDALKRAIEDGKQSLTVLESDLRKALGNFDELFGITRQVAGDTMAQLDNSIISAQFPGRQERLAGIARDEKALPGIEQLRELWLILLQEQGEQAKVTRFETEINMGGRPKEQTVTRIGPFSAVSEGKFLVFNSDAQRLTALPRQPAAVYRRSAERLESAAPGELVAATVDPSSGSILSLLVQTPSLMERFHQGGLVGYIVSLLAALGLLIGCQRLASLWLTGRRVHRQMRSLEVSEDNPLGRVLQSYEESGGADAEALERKLEDAILKEVPKLERGLNTLKVLAAVAPLMGLLGTVIGMILTFQSITLWGTGDPKLMAGGISQALMTTVLGLIAAIPLLLLHNVASGRARLLQQILQEQSAGLVAKRAEVAHG